MNVDSYSNASCLHVYRCVDTTYPIVWVHI